MNTNMIPYNYLIFGRVSNYCFTISTYFLIILIRVVSSESTGGGCPLPQTPYNGNFEVKGCEGILKDPFFGPCWKNPKILFPVEQVVHYFCLPGHILRGEKDLTCLESGKWNHPFPRCCKPRPRVPATTGNSPDGPLPMTKIELRPSLDVYEKAVEKRFEEPSEGQELTSPTCPPLLKTKNVEFECLTPDGRLNNCEEPPFPAYTVAHLKCAKYYKSAGDLAYRYRKCKPDGTWSTEGSISCISDCGKTSVPKKPLITNGVTSERGQWPWHAALYTRIRGRWEYICGGSLISNRVILTAAHCVTGSDSTRVTQPDTLYAILGKFHRQFGGQEENEQGKHVQKILVHPNYSPNSFDSDIALVILHSPVQFTFFVRPVCFPESFNSLIEEYQIQEGNLGTVIGWGLKETGLLANDLQEAQLPVVAAPACIESYKEFFQAQNRYTNFCAGYLNGTGVCNGDSGGGMVFPSGEGDNQRWYLQGIVSVGAPDPLDSSKCNSHQYSLFTRVGRYSDWIVRTLTLDGFIE